MSDYEKRILVPKPSSEVRGSAVPGGRIQIDDGKRREALADKHGVAAAKLAAQLTTLPTDSAERKEYPMLSGCLKYFPAALAGIARISKLGNDKHNPGQPLHHARGKSTDHGDCIIRHLTDTEDLLAAQARGALVTQEQILTEVNQLAWRVLAYSQELHEKFGSPLAPGARTLASGHDVCSGKRTDLSSNGEAKE